MSIRWNMSPQGILIGAAAIAAGVVAWKAYSEGKKLAQAASELWAAGGQKITEATASVGSALQNNVVAPFQQGQAYGTNGTVPEVSEKAWLYSDYGYTGVDTATGVPVVDGEFFGDAVARRYAQEQYERGAQPAAQSINGAAFGIYPKP